MYIRIMKNNGIEYLRLVEGYREFDKASKKYKTKQRTLLNIGPLHKVTDGKENFFERLKKSFNEGNPILPSLLPFVKNKKPENQVIVLPIGSDFATSVNKIFSHVILDKIIDDLNLNDFFRKYKYLNKINFDLIGFFRLLIFGRILNPSSNIFCTNSNDKYYNPIVKDMYKFNIYDTLDFIHKYDQSIFKTINSALINNFGRTTNNIFYDVTNFYFEIDRPDEETEESIEVVEKKLRKMGVSKENRNLPITQMSMFIDQQGIPISINTFPGNTLDGNTLVPSIKESISDFKFKDSKFIFVGDRGIFSFSNANFIINSSNGYIFSKSILKSKKDEKEWIYNQDNFNIVDENFKYKSKVFTRIIERKDLPTKRYNEKVIIYWSRKFYERQMYENRRFIDFVNRLKENPKSFKISKQELTPFKKFFKDEMLNIKTEDIIKSKDLRHIIDEEKINRFKESFGYYQIVTSEIQMDDLEIINTYKNLNTIEEQFKVLKSSLDTRPMFVRTSEHIKAHLTVCSIALIVIKVLQNRVNKYLEENVNKRKKKDRNRMSVNRIIEALKSWTVTKIDEKYYKHSIGNEETNLDLYILLKALDIKIEKKYYTKEELRQIKKSVKLF